VYRLPDARAPRAWYTRPRDRDDAVRDPDLRDDAWDLASENGAMSERTVKSDSACVARRTAIDICLNPFAEVLQAKNPEQRRFTISWKAALLLEFFDERLASCLSGA
jgi:hypothetical protein